MKIREGRGESGLYRLLVYIVLIAGGLPIVLPLYWLVLASLKTHDGISASPPAWVPIDARDFITLEGQTLRVSVLDDGLASQTGVARVKLLRNADRTLELPVARIEHESTVEQRVELAGVRRRVKALGSPDRDGMVMVALTGTMRQAQVASQRIQVRQESHYIWSVLGVSFEVERIGGAGLDAESVTIRWSGPSPMIRVRPQAVMRRNDMTFVHWRQQSLAAEIVSSNSAGGFETIRLLSRPGGHLAPAAELRRAGRVVRYLAPESPGGTRRVIRVLRRDREQSVSTIEFLDDPDTVRVRFDRIERITTQRYYATLLGRRVTVEPRSLPLPRDPSASVALDVPGAVPVAADRLAHEAPLRPRWSNYVAAWREQDFDLYVFNTLFIAVLVVLGTVLSCGLVGYGFARCEFRGRDFLFLVLLSTMMLPTQVTSIPMFVMFAKFGWLDSYKPLIVPHFLAQSAFFVFLYRQFMLTVPVDLEDSARIDGCGPLQTWWLIMMPLCRPIVVTVAVLSFIGVWNDFLHPLLYINSDEKQTVALGLQSFKTAYRAAAPQLIMAASVMMIVPSIILFFIAQKAFMRGVVVSGVKG